MGLATCVFVILAATCVIDGTLIRVFCFFVDLVDVTLVFFFFSSRRRHTRCLSDWSSDVCSSDLIALRQEAAQCREMRHAKRSVRRHHQFSRAQSHALDHIMTEMFIEPRPPGNRSEERRVGKEWRARWSAYKSKKRRQCREQSRRL